MVANTDCLFAQPVTPKLAQACGVSRAALLYPLRTRKAEPFWSTALAIYPWLPVAIAFGVALSTAVKYAPKTDCCLLIVFPDASLINVTNTIVVFCFSSRRAWTHGREHFTPSS